MFAKAKIKIFLNLCLHSVSTEILFIGKIVDFTLWGKEYGFPKLHIFGLNFTVYACRLLSIVSWLLKKYLISICRLLYLNLIDSPNVLCMKLLILMFQFYSIFCRLVRLEWVHVNDEMLHLHWKMNLWRIISGRRAKNIFAEIAILERIMHTNF